MPKTKTTGTSRETASEITPLVAATLAGVIYQARMMNHQLKINIPEDELTTEVVSLWRTVVDALGVAEK